MEKEDDCEINPVSSRVCERGTKCCTRNHISDTHPQEEQPVSWEKKILDACCSGRMFWFNKAHPDALYIDIREEADFQTGKGVDNRHRAIKPDIVMDFRKMDLPDNQFSLVVFDPPHLKIGRKSYFAQIYGSLEDTWQEDIRAGFSECFRVLKPDGVLIFKWNESDIPLREILALTPVEPLFGHRSGKAMKTHWITFMKLAALIEPS